GMAKGAGGGSGARGLPLPAARQIEPGRTVLEAPDPAGVHPVAAGHRLRLAGALEIRALRVRDLPAIDENPRRAPRRIRAQGAAELEAGQHLPRDRLALPPPGAGDRVVPVPAWLDRHGVNVLQLADGVGGEGDRVDDDLSRRISSERRSNAKRSEKQKSLHEKFALPAAPGCGASALALVSLSISAFTAAGSIATRP